LRPPSDVVEASADIQLRMQTPKHSRFVFWTLKFQICAQAWVKPSASRHPSVPGCIPHFRTGLVRSGRSR
jgi:hypothetical protein